MIFCSFGATDGNRTHDPHLTKAMAKTKNKDCLNEIKFINDNYLKNELPADVDDIIATAKVRKVASKEAQQSTKNPTLKR